MSQKQSCYKLIMMTDLIFCRDFLLFHFVYSSTLPYFNDEKCAQNNSNSSNLIIEKELVNSTDSNSVWIIWNSVYFTRVILYSIRLLSEQPILSPITKRIQSKHSFNISTCEDSVRVEVFINCLRSTTNLQTKSQCSVAISSICPQRTIHYIISLFIFMRTSLLCRDDPHSLAVVLQAIHKIIAVVLQASSIDTVEILTLFVTALDQITTHSIVPILTSFFNVSLHSIAFLTSWICWYGIYLNM